jgi:hypothetical protein
VSSWRPNSLLAALVLASAPAWADEPYTVEVRALRNPVDKSYRRMVKGMDLFDEMHALAPKASLRYKLLPRKRGTDIDDVVLQVVGNSFRAAVAVAPDHTFTLARYPEALKQDALVRSERRAQSMTWRAEVRTPGLPAGTRRLGDLRLECLVGKEAGLVSQYPSVIGALASLTQSARAFCNDSYVPYLFFADRALFSVTLSSGSRRQTLSVGELYAGIAHGRTRKQDLTYCDCESLLDRAYIVPLGDRSWPDDTLVELEAMDQAAPSAEASLDGWTRSDVRALLGEGKVIRFDSGFEVWAYEYGPAERPLAQTEWLVLFAPNGVVAKSRLRPAPQ